MTKKPRRKPKAIRVYERFFSYKKWELERKHPKGKRFFPWLYLTLVLPWVLIWRWLKHDWRLFIVFGAWCAIVSCEVWVPYIIGLVTWGTEASKYWFSVGSAFWVWWLSPGGSPFLAICLGLTALTEIAWKGIKALIGRKGKKK